MRLPTASCPSFSLASAAGSGAGSRATKRSPPQDAGGMPEAEPPPEGTPACSPHLEQPAGGTWQSGLPCCRAACILHSKFPRASGSLIRAADFAMHSGSQKK